MTQAIQIDNLVKSYDTNSVIKGISFSVERGEIIALLGTNGAGKTTTLECIEGLRKYDDGKIEVNGKIGVQLQSSSLPEAIKAIEAYDLFCSWNKVKPDYEQFNAFGLDGIKQKKYKDMSTGQKRRLHLALALIGNPDIIFLDEPTAGLDVEGRVSLHTEIRKLKANGKTIIMASHDMAEVESLCDRIAILKDGKIAFIGTLYELTAQIGSVSHIRIKTSKGEEMLTTENITEALLKHLESYKQNGITVLDINTERATLEERFMQISKEGK